jgi:DNA-binding NarL/FixJ family response regulator
MKSVSHGNVLIVDPDKFVRTFLADVLVHSRFTVFNSAANSTEALVRFKIGSVQVAILELDLGDSIDGYNLAHSLRVIDPNIGIVFLTTSQDARFMNAAGSHKPKGARYLVKKEIENIPQLVSVIAQTVHRPFYENVNLENVFSELTNLQVEIWKEVARGDSSSKIAEHHNISEKAVEGTLARIYLILEIKKSKLTNPRVLLSQAFSRYQGKI